MITLKSAREIDAMARAGRIVAAFQHSGIRSLEFT